MVFRPASTPIIARHTVTSAEETAGQYSDSFDPQQGRKWIKITFAQMYNEDTAFNKCQLYAVTRHATRNVYFIDEIQNGLSSLHGKVPRKVYDIEKIEWIFFDPSASDVCRVLIYYEVEE